MPDKKKILTEIKSNLKHTSIKLPSKIAMRWINSDTVLMNFSKDLVVENMQEDNTAFEAWAVILKRWIPEISKVIISWQPPDDIGDNHYQRFLYRVVNFNKLFDWFDIDNNCSLLADKLDYGKTGVKYFINIPGKRTHPEPLELINVSSGESAIEAYIYNYPEDLKQICNLSFLDRQLPVGIFKNEVRNGSEIFTKGKSAIDLWGISKDNKLSIFELKNFENRKAGIISEILFYSFVMRDLQNNLINIPDNTKNNDILSVKSSNGIISYLLVPNVHPLIDDVLINLLNINLSSNNIEIRYIKISDSDDGKLKYTLK